MLDKSNESDQYRQVFMQFKRLIETMPHLKEAFFDNPHYDTHASSKKGISLMQEKMTKQMKQIFEAFWESTALKSQTRESAKSGYTRFKP